jgi:hypothetical protein
MVAPYTIFGKTRMVPVRLFLNGAEVKGDSWDEEIWVERDEDTYGTANGKVIRYVLREDWLRAKDI